MPSPEIIHVNAMPDDERDAVVIGKPFNWVRLCLYAAALSAAFVVGGYLADYLGLLGFAK